MSPECNQVKIDRFESARIRFENLGITEENWTEGQPILESYENELLLPECEGQTDNALRHIEMLQEIGMLSRDNLEDAIVEFITIVWYRRLQDI